MPRFHTQFSAQQRTSEVNKDVSGAVNHMSEIVLMVLFYAGRLTRMWPSRISGHRVVGLVKGKQNALVLVWAG